MVTLKGPSNRYRPTNPQATRACHGLKPRVTIDEKRGQFTPKLVISGRHSRRSPQIRRFSALKAAADGQFSREVLTILL